MRIDIRSVLDISGISRRLRERFGFPSSPSINLKDLKGPADIAEFYGIGIETEYSEAGVRNDLMSKGKQPLPVIIPDNDEFAKACAFSAPF